jgi:hypothetical protein
MKAVIGMTLITVSFNFLFCVNLTFLWPCTITSNLKAKSVLEESDGVNKGY